MPKAKFIFLLILFLPYMNYGMKRKGEDREENSKQELIRKKMKVDNLCALQLSLQENIRIQALINLLPKKERRSYECLLCQPTNSFKRIRQHLVKYHIQPFHCVTCNKILPNGVSFGTFLLSPNLPWKSSSFLRKKKRCTYRCRTIN